MFNKFLSNKGLDGIDLSGIPFPASTDRGFWDNYNEPGLTESAEALLDYPWPIISATAFREFKATGDRGVMEKPHFERRKNLVTLVLAEAKENKGRFLPQILNGAFAICEETFWGVSAHWHPEGGIKYLPHFDKHYIDLFAAETAEHLAMAAYVLEKPLSEYCPDILERIEFELEERIKKPYMAHEDFWWMGRTRRTNNWNPWIISNLITVYLVAEKDEEKKRAAFGKMLSELQYYLDSLPEDGGCDEGAEYWGKAGASLFECLFQLKEATDGKINFFGEEKLRGVAEYMKRVHIVGPYFVCFADCVPTPKRSAGLFVYAYGRELGSEELMDLGAEMLFKGLSADEKPYSLIDNVRRNIYYNRFFAQVKERSGNSVTHPALELAPSLQVAILRAGEWTLACKGGHNKESHNHNDVGAFSLYDNGKPVLVDVGIGTYTRLTFSDERYTIPWVNSRTHNLPMINGTEQKEGREFAADLFRAEEGRVSVSFAAAYPEKAGISSLEREYSLTKEGFSFTDTVAFRRDGGTVTETLVTTLVPEIKSGAVILDGGYRITAEGVISVEYLSFGGDKKLENSHNAEGVYLVRFSTEEKTSLTVRIDKI